MIQAVLFGVLVPTLAVGQTSDFADRPTRPPLAIDSLRSIGGDDFEGQRPFGRIADVEIGEDGSLYVLDAQARNVRIFDQQGRETGVLGGPGRGPGEFRAPGALLWGADGMLWVLDPGNGRLTAFDRRGMLAETVTASGLATFIPLALRFVDDRTLRLVGVTSPDPAAPSAAWVEAVIADGVVRPTRQSELPFVEWPQLYEHRTADVAFVLPVPFSGEPLFTFDSEGAMWYGNTRETSIRRWSPEGGLVAEVGHDPQPVPVTPADRERTLARPEFDELREAAGPQGLRRFAEMMPETKPHLSGFLVHDQEVWVMGTSDGPSPQSLPIDVYDSAGEVVATLTASLSAHPRPRIRGNLLLGVVRDSLDVESLVLYRVRRDGR